MVEKTGLLVAIALIHLAFLAVERKPLQKKHQHPTSVSPSNPTTPPPASADTITQTLSDEAQRTTLAFSGLAMMTGNLEAQTFFPSGQGS